jgi:hypothetical protein
MSTTTDARIRGLAEKIAIANPTAGYTDAVTQARRIVAVQEREDALAELRASLDGVTFGDIVAENEDLLNAAAASGTWHMPADYATTRAESAAKADAARVAASERSRLRQDGIDRLGMSYDAAYEKWPEPVAETVPARQEATVAPSDVVGRIEAAQAELAAHAAKLGISLDGGE